jgi:hypothetical protein
MAAFKTDESFLEKISIGAIGTRKVFETLEHLGHEPIELERGSMNYKIWKKIKIKRIRVPDILCVDNGIRVESRAKTNLEISMSHSTSDPDRGWDFGMRDNDYVALVVCKKKGEGPTNWEADNLVQFISIKNLRDAEYQGHVVFVKPKGAQEGFEARITWPSCLASSEGVITEITQTTVKYKTVGGKKLFVKLSKGGKTLMPLVQAGEKVYPNQIIASTVPVQQNLPTIKVRSDFFLTNLASLNLSERYASTKALGRFNEKVVITALKQKLSEGNEHIYVKLEAAACLARFNQDEGYTFIKDCLRDSYLQNVLEAVIVLAEIKSDVSCALLCDILLDENYDSEIRAGAAWGLGEQRNKGALKAIVSSFNSVEESVKVEAARALGKLTEIFSNEIINQFDNASSLEMPGLAWALSKSKTITLDQLLGHMNGHDSRQWISYIIGTQGEQRYIAEIEKLKKKDPEMYFAVSLLWKMMTSWIYELKEY